MAGDRLVDAAILGVAGGMRSFVPPAALSARGRYAPLPRPYVVYALALGELVADKHPRMGARTEPPGIAGRLLGSGSGGYVLAGREGAALCAGVALATAQICRRLRGVLADRLGSDLAGALAEDALALSIAAYATR
jgi:uncharacterized membrane protein